ncbi:class I SAM-dependent methyltransferase [Pseudomaricurvus alkylphenolicus]|uniref:class I SAM-dependent methyltransferase n=1 Tax=Pseudomaricurvus alkylphenolicus TaxID=1306991 RepID=UPI00141F2BFB|nr:class I SAM-dependent methyltransferase [Pseudomaricurvus alkylphenolicus]NIB44400.1 class I SAM-dependent methyltransferase [Pseudomaricurvus alkylphenolicus]
MFGNRLTAVPSKIHSAASLFAGVMLATSLAASVQAAEPVTEALQQAVSSDSRSSGNVARDKFRNPGETLQFFGVKPDSQVIEIWPGRGWYSEILAPYLAVEGEFYAAHFPVNTEVAYFKRARDGYAQMLKDKAEVYGKTHLTEFYPPTKVQAGPDEGGVDHVLTFRNVHNWMKAGYAPQAFENFFQMLKPGGILGVVEHRAKPGTSEEDMIRSGYVTEAKVELLAAQAGFELVGKSEVNANPKDSADHPKGVWTLPPSLRLGEEDRKKYLAIGESDRMTLKFRKPNR